MFEHADNFIVKITRDCNLRCKYCYIKNKNTYKNEVMSFNVFTDFVNRIIEDKIKNDVDRNKVITFTFHGGEPTLVGYDMLNKYLSYAYISFKKAKIKVQFSIQTNGTLITDELLNLFRDYKVHVGISYDGIGDNNKNRNSLSSSVYEDIVKKFEKNHVKLGNICVVSKCNIDNIEKNFEYFNQINLPTKYNFVEDVYNLGDCEVPGYDFFHKCIKPMLDMSLKNKDINCIPDYSIRELIIDYCIKYLTKTDNLRENTRNKGICGIKFCGGGCKVIEISPDGTVHSCGRCDESDTDSIIGNIYSKDFLGLHSFRKYCNNMYQRNLAILNSNCDLCESQDICNFGCMSFSFVKGKIDSIDKDLICSYYKEFKKYIYENIDNFILIYIDYIINEKSGLIDIHRKVDKDTINNMNKVLKDHNIYNIKPSLEMNNKDTETYNHKILITKI